MTATEIKHRHWRLTRAAAGVTHQKVFTKIFSGKIFRKVKFQVRSTFTGLLVDQSQSSGETCTLLVKDYFFSCSVRVQAGLSVLTTR